MTDPAFTIELSEVESNRFGYRIGRARPETPVTGPDLRRAILDGAYDIVIVRTPASWKRQAVELAAIEGYVAFTADNLTYWEWPGQQVQASPESAMPELVMPEGLQLCCSQRVEDIVEIVRDSFPGYKNHYSANPLFDTAKSLEGYCEWVATLMAADSTTLMVVDEHGDGLGFAITDWSGEKPDLTLASVRFRPKRAPDGSRRPPVRRPSRLGQGLYAHLIAGSVELAIKRERLPISTSTQVDNTTVIRNWAMLGFVPVDTVSTFHVVREDLL